MGFLPLFLFLIGFLIFDFRDFSIFFCLTVGIWGTVLVRFLVIFMSWNLLGDLIGMFKLLKAVNGFLVVLGVLPDVKPSLTRTGGLLVASVVIGDSAGSSLTPGWPVTVTGGGGGRGTHRVSEESPEQTGL